MTRQENHNLIHGMALYAAFVAARRGVAKTEAREAWEAWRVMQDDYTWAAAQDAWSIVTGAERARELEREARHAQA